MISYPFNQNLPAAVAVILSGPIVKVERRFPVVMERAGSLVLISADFPNLGEILFVEGFVIALKVIFDRVVHVVRSPSLMTVKQSTSPLKQGQQGSRSPLLPLRTSSGIRIDRARCAIRGCEFMLRACWFISPNLVRADNECFGDFGLLLFC